MVKRVLLIAILALIVVRIGVALGPRISGLTRSRPQPAALPPVPEARSPMPSWGGGSIGVSSGSPAVLLDSFRQSLGRDTQGLRTMVGGDFGIAMVGSPDSNYRLTMAFRSPDGSGRSMLLDMPDAGQFRRQLMPDTDQASTPAADVPLYPGARCRMQVGEGSTNFIGFYLTPDSIGLVRSYYQEQLARRGWEKVEHEQEGNLDAFVKDRGARSVLVNLRPQDDSTTRLGLVVTGPQPAAEPARR